MYKDLFLGVREYDCNISEENLSSEKMSMIKNEIIDLCEKRKNGKEITYKACLNYVSANK